MLTEEILKGVEGLTPAQIDAIKTLSKNDEEVVIGAKIGEIHGGYEKDVLELTGQEKNKGEKAYDYVKRVLGAYKADLETSSSSLTALKAEKETLEAKFKEGGDKALLQKIKDAEDKIKAFELTREEEKAAFTAKEAEYQEKIKGIKLEHILDKSLSSLKFSSAYPDDAVKRNIAAAKMSLFAEYQADFDEQGNAILRDKEGAIVRDKDDNNNPLTLSKAFAKNLDFMIDKGKQGAGTGTTAPNGGRSVALNLAGASTQVQADGKIKEYLMAQGITTTDPKYYEQSKQIREDNGVDKLPMR